MAASALKVESNRANAQHSTGPVTPEGKEISSKNSSKHNLTGGPALAPGEDDAAYKAHHKQYMDDYHPLTLPELELVDQLADASWRLLRVAKMEREFLAAHPNPFLNPEDPASAQLLRLTRYRNSIQRTYDRAFKTLQAILEAAQHRRDADRPLVEQVVKEDKQAAGLDTNLPEVKKQVRTEVERYINQLACENARTVLALLNRDRS